MNSHNLNEDSQLTWRELGVNAQGAHWMLSSKNEAQIMKKSKSDDSKEDEENPRKKHTLFFFPSIKKHEGKGTQVYTPDGYGLLQEGLTKEKNLFKVKIKGVINEYPVKSILSEIPISIRFLLSNINSEVTILIPVNTLSKDLFKRTQSELELYGMMFFSPKLFIHGKELNPLNELTLEQMGIKPKEKIMVTTFLMKNSFKVNRFSNCQTDWGYSNSVDAISFSASKDIFVVGFGVYRPHNLESSDLKTIAKLFEGSNCDGEAKVQKEVMIPYNSQPGEENSASNPNRIFRVNFDKPVKIKADSIYSCLVQIETGSSFYGDGGKDSINGENDVDFKFSICESSKNGTGIDYGQIPEIYYFL